MPSLCEDDQMSGLVVEVLYVENCPNFPAALALVQRVQAELGVDAEVRTTMISDQAAAERARLWVPHGSRRRPRCRPRRRARCRVYPGGSPVLA